MRKVAVVVAFALLSALTLVGCKKDKEKDVKLDIMTKVRASMEKEDDTVENSTEMSVEIAVETTAPEGEGGGNEFLNDDESVKVKTVAILVNEDKYFCENALITMEEIVAMLENIEGELVVEITDNNATHKAYNKLVDKLTDLEITFIEE